MLLELLIILVLLAIATRLGFIRFVLAKKRMLEKKAEQERRELRFALLDALSHEIKTPLTAIKASVTALLSGPPMSGRKSELLSIIDEETDRLDRVVTESIDVAKIEFLDLKLKKSCNDVKSTIASLLREINYGSAKCIRTSLPEELPPVNISDRLAKLALKQLVDNALKYSVPGSPILISAREHSGKIVLTVEDSGPGISLEVQSRIFERDRRPDGKVDSTSGTGIGLSIARRIIEAHGGSIELASRESGGCAFRVLLPACRRRR